MIYTTAEIRQNHNGSVNLAKFINKLISKEIIDDFFWKYSKRN